MIEDLQALREHMQAVAADYPVIADNLLLVPRAGDPAGWTDLVDALSLPPAYAQFAGRWKIEGISIGTFNLFPGGRRGVGLIEALSNCNDADNAASYVEVAGEAMNPVFAGKADSPFPDRIYWMDSLEGPGSALFIAEDFERYMLLAGNLHQISTIGSDAEEDKLAQLEERCRRLGCDDEQTRFWASFLA